MHSLRSVARPPIPPQRCPHRTQDPSFPQGTVALDHHWRPLLLFVSAASAWHTRRRPHHRQTQKMHASRATPIPGESVCFAQSTPNQSSPRFAYSAASAHQAPTAVFHHHHHHPRSLPYAKLNAFRLNNSTHYVPLNCMSVSPIASFIRLLVWRRYFVRPIARVCSKVNNKKTHERSGVGHWRCKCLRHRVHTHVVG
ncbi:hypothetical protein, unlikely [Trypanosoma brucei brucei TREU927]|uniref:Uncharacterized protein n=1 Tax=Trypanosoma brucei brucei (strain 927/4 GUTat10.1) TaxID=185431 RepID=Q38D99_TRYB2|nr:hypothetical protein, unlikely [Trypanosoma brucei brucei TREU927]EAN77221.1 hypothetical protein, unlikely [Trypanosoma brucei brucei TREU927]